MSFKAFEPSEAMMEALRKRLGQGDGAAKESGEGRPPSTTTLPSASRPVKFQAPQAPMLGVHSEEIGSGSWNSCSFSHGQHQVAPHSVPSYSGSSFAPQLAGNGGLNVDILSGTGPSMSSSARMPPPGAGVGLDASPEKRLGGAMSSHLGSAHSKSMERLQPLPEEGSSLPPRPSSGKFGMFKASSSLYPRPNSPGKKEPMLTTQNDIASVEPHASAPFKAASVPYIPSTPVLPHEPSTSQSCQPSSQMNQGDNGEPSGEAADDDFTYLGAGLYGRRTENNAAPPAPKKSQKKERVKVLPGRVAPLPQKLVPRMPPRPSGPLQGAGEQICSPMALPPRSMKLEATERIAAQMREERAQSAKRARSQDSFACPAFGSSARGRMAQGSSAPPSSRLTPGAPVPIPNACGEREKKRLENREARRQVRASQLEEPDCQTGRLSHVSSAPSLGAYARPAMDRPVPEVAVPSAEDIEKQKMRLACKMEILGFYDGYRGALGKMTADQNKKLASKLNSRDTEAVTDTVKQLNKERQQQLDEWSKKADNQKSVHRRLKLINEFYSDAFTGESQD